MTRTKLCLAIALAAPVIALAALVAVQAGGDQGAHHYGGDPGGVVMKQLVSALPALPGFSTGAVPWVESIPPSLGAAYAIRIEPSWSSCGQDCAGCYAPSGWGQVVVQARFHWSASPGALFALVGSRLVQLGWSEGSAGYPGPPQRVWHKHLRNGSRASIDVSKQYSSAVWQFDVTAPPVGKAVNCP